MKRTIFALALLALVINSGTLQAESIGGLVTWDIGATQVAPAAVGQFIRVDSSTIKYDADFDFVADAVLVKVSDHHYAGGGHDLTYDETTDTFGLDDLGDPWEPEEFWWPVW